MTGIEEADTAKIVSLVDKECVADNDVATLSSSFELLTSMGVEYSIDYKITSTEKANRATIKNMCEGLYGDTSVASKVRCAYICDVDYTMTINYLGETETEDVTDLLQEGRKMVYRRNGRERIRPSLI